MGIKAVFRVQCDGPCGGWLSQTGGVVRLNPPSRDVGLYPGERAARTAATQAGWSVRITVPVKVLCPDCTVNPLGIILPKPCGYDKCQYCQGTERTS